MKFRASNKRWISALAAAVMVCVCATASAQSYRLGDEADEIATIQTALKQLKLYSAGITGHFGEKTETAVKKFQKKYALENNGVVDEATRAALYEAAGITYTAGSSSSGTSSSSSSVSSAGTTLRYDMRGDAVLKLQQDLNKLGYYSGTISGHFGSKTEAAVMSFQRANGLSADGIAGSKTLAKIATALGSSSSGSSSNSSSSNSSSSSASSSSLLKQGTKSEAVRTLQQNLKTLGYYTGSVTGNFGPLTKEAVYSFQKANGLSADGIAGEKTLAAVSSKLKGGSSSGSSNSSSSSSNNSSSSASSLLNTSLTLQQGTKNDEVLKLQNMLTSLGFYTGNKTGNFGEKTADAVIAYQKSKGLTADGIAGKKTLAAINADYSGSSVIGNNNGNANAPTPSMANNVLYENFYNWRRNYANGEYCTVYDFSTGYSWKLRIMTKDAHMDAEPATAEDTAIMIKAFGNKTTWTPKPVWVTFSDGKTYIGSTHDVPHSPQHLTSNNFAGHLCVHFPIPMSKAESIGSYAVSHQEAINEGWEMTQKLKY